MSFAGWANPFPCEFGAGPTGVENIYFALRSAGGRGGAAEDDEHTIDGLWRQCRARAVATVAASGERSALQAFPDRATDLLPYYERLVGAASDPAGDPEARREGSALLFTRQIASAVPDIALALQSIDSRFSVLATSYAESDTTLFGRAFQDFAGALPFGGGRQSTRLPNYSTSFVLFVVLELGAGIVPSTTEQRAIANAGKLLAEVLPGHNSYQIVTHQGVGGFTLDVDLLDLTSFGA
jgi:hypothetical protein